jgi:membrane fusion protein, adhesin transport system
VNVSSTQLAKDTFARTRIPSLVKRAGWVTSFAVLATVVLLLIAPWQQSVLGMGEVMARAPVDRQQRIDAPIKGRIVNWHVVEGSHVRAGDPIVEISDVDPRYVERLNQRMAATRDRLEATVSQTGVYRDQERSYERSRQLKVKAAALKVLMAEQKVQAATQKLEAEKAELKTTELNLVRERRLVEQGLSSRRALELAELSETKARAALNLRHAELSEAQSNLLAEEAERYQVDAESTTKSQSAAADAIKAGADSAYANEDLAKLEVELARQNARIVTAPRDGTILSINGGLGGRVVSIGDELAVLVPDTDSRAIELWIDGNDLPLMSEGRAVRVQFEGWPAVQFVGWPSVAVGTFGGRIAVVDSSTVRVGQFRVLVTPDPTEPAWPSPDRLRQGLRAQGWILLDRVRLGWELWRRFNGFPQSIVRPDKTSAGKDKPNKASYGEDEP